MDVPDEHRRVNILRVMAAVALSILAGSSSFAQAPSDKVVWSASGAAGLRIIPKSVDEPSRSEIIPASGIEPLRAPDNLPLYLPDSAKPSPTSKPTTVTTPTPPPQPTTTATLCDQPGIVTTGPVTGLRRIDFFPTSLLWEPPLANKREPRSSALFSALSNEFSQRTVDTQIGGTFGVARFTPEWTDFEIQLDLFGVVDSRFSEYDHLVAADYRVGIPLSVRRGPWVAKLAYEHTSTQLGNELIATNRARRIEYTKDEIVLGLSYVFDERLRFYGQGGYSVHQIIPTDPKKYRFDVGFEWFPRAATGPVGTPFVAANVGFRGEHPNDADITVQAGWLWRNPDRRFSQIRVFGEFYNGKSNFGQLFGTRESCGALGVSLDY